MKMQMREVLIFSAVDDETIGFEMEFIHKALDGGVQVRQKGGVLRVEAGEGIHLPLWEDEHVDLIAWRRVMKRKQVRGLTEAINWDEKTHVGENPADKSGNKSKAKNFTHFV
jgi:hypothetical protein